MGDDSASLPEDYIKYDPENLRRDILQMPAQAEQGYKSVEAIDLNSLKENYSDVIVAGMGGSSIAGLLLQSYLADDKLKITVVQDYSLPKWAGKNTLVLVCSYSGNTEETLTVFKEARRSNCGIVAFTVGGKLEEYVKIPRLPIASLPSGFQPRAAVAAQFFSMLRILERLRLIESKAKDVLRLKDDLKGQIPALEKNAVSLSERFVAKTPIIYTSSKFESIGYRWKCQFNENAKRFAFNNIFSEQNHNEIEAFENVLGAYHAIFLRFEEDHRRVQQRMNLVKEIMLKKGIGVTDIGIRGPSLLSKMFSAIILGDLTAYYLALRLKTNPSQVNLIEDFKRSLGPYVG
jgi:glucose/mannose-6-phosphate isomerase